MSKQPHSSHHVLIQVLLNLDWCTEVVNTEKTNTEISSVK